MTLRRLTSMLAAAALGSSALVAAASAPANGAEATSLGKRSLAAVLAADGGGFDRTATDFDVLDNAVQAVLAAKPDSPVSVLADGRVRLTAFAPTDGAFRRLVGDLTGTRYERERRVFRVLARTAGIETIETVLLYHVVPGDRITYWQARHADGARLVTAADKAAIRVNVRPSGAVYLRDRDRDDRNARVFPALKNLNKGNRQLAHGVSQVLRPVDL